MKFKSAASLLTDPYRAGFEIGDALKDVTPEVILMFASITLEQGYPDFYEGLCDALETREFILAGGSGDGIYETGVTAHYGVCALGMSSAGAVRWGVSVQTGIGADSAGIACSCGAAAQEQLAEPPVWGLVLADGITADGTGVVAGLLKSIACPVIGGLTGDDRKFRNGRVFFNQQMLEDSILVLLAAGMMSFAVHSASGFVPSGSPGVIEETRDNELVRISGKSAVAFVREQTGKSLAEADIGVLAFAGRIDSSHKHHVMRMVRGFDTSGGTISTFGSIPVGTTVSISGADREGLIHAVTSCAETVSGSGIRAAAAIVISCVARKWQLCSCGQEEVQAIQEVTGTRIPLIGFPSFGEIGPFIGNDGNVSSSHFHNGTCIVCLLGE